MKALKVSVPSGDSQPGIQTQKLMQRQNHRIMRAGKDLQGCPVQPVTVQTTEVKIEPRNLQTQESPLGKSQQHLPSRNQLPLSNTLHLRRWKQSFNSSHQLSFVPFEMSDLLLWQGSWISPNFLFSDTTQHHQFYVFIHKKSTLAVSDIKNIFCPVSCVFPENQTGGSLGNFFPGKGFKMAALTCDTHS